MVAVFLGILMVSEAMLLLYVTYYHLGLRDHIGQLYTVVFDFLAFSATLNILVVRERGRFWESAPSSLLAFSTAGDILAVFLISTFGVQELAPVSPWTTFAVLAYSSVTCLLINDFVKVLLVRRLLAKPQPA